MASFLWPMLLIDCRLSAPSFKSPSLPVSDSVPTTNVLPIYLALSTLSSYHLQDDFVHPSIIPSVVASLSPLQFLFSGSLKSCSFLISKQNCVLLEQLPPVPCLHHQTPPNHECLSLLFPTLSPFLSSLPFGICLIIFVLILSKVTKMFIIVKGKVLFKTHVIRPVCFCCATLHT